MDKKPELVLGQALLLSVILNKLFDEINVFPGFLIYNVKELA